MIRITQPVIDAMIAHARRESPLECCGLVYGPGDVSDRLLACSNEAASSVAFAIPLEELFDGFRRIRGEGRRLTGIYHSHPCGPEIPSRKDLAEFEYRDAACWIVSLQGGRPVVRCFRWTSGGFVEESFTVEGAGPGLPAPSDR